MIQDLIALDLEQALTQPSCPVCHLRHEAELSHIRALFSEDIRDPFTPQSFINSLGYCPEHSWEAGLLEAEHIGIPLGNSVIYQYLVDTVQTRLENYLDRLPSADQPFWKRWIHRLQHGIPNPQALYGHEHCPICEIGAQVEQTDLSWLLDGLAEPESELRTLYEHSDGLCLSHLHRALEMAGGDHIASTAFLVRTSMQRLSALNKDLAAFERKSNWKHKRECLTEDERKAWLRALVFFAGNPIVYCVGGVTSITRQRFPSDAQAVAAQTITLED